MTKEKLKMTESPEMFDLPEKMENITVRIVREPYVTNINTNDLFGDLTKIEDICCDVCIWGDPDKRKRIFTMRMEEKIWKPLYDEILSDIMLSDKIDRDPDLTFLRGVIISIWGTTNTYGMKRDMHGCIDSRVLSVAPITYEIKIRHDLEDAEKIGGKLLEKAIEKEIKTNRLSLMCIERNLR